MCINYSGNGFTSGPKLLHFEGRNWQNMTVSVDTINQNISESVSSFSLFAVFQRISTALPTLSLALLSNTLWPPNGKLVPIAASIAVSDVCDWHPSVVLVSINANEPLGSNDIQGANFGTNDRSFQLAASRSGSGQGRVYTVTYQVTDSLGHMTRASATVIVPHDQGKN